MLLARLSEVRAKIDKSWTQKLVRRINRLNSGFGIQLPNCADQPFTNQHV
jgi:hypothetical protein